MKKIILFLILLTFQKIYSQKIENDKFQIHSFSIAFGGFNPEKGSDKHTVWYTDFNLTTNYKKNLFAFTVDGTFDWLFSFFGEKPERENIQFSMLYGREIPIIKNVNFELLAGIGHFKETHRVNNYVSWEKDFNYIKKPPNNSVKKLSLSGISFPVKLRLVIDYSKKGALGLNFSHSFNSISTYNSTGLFFRYKF